MNAIDLTYLKAVKDFTEVNSTKDDAIISSLITSFSQWCLTYCSRDTLNSVQQYIEVYDGNGSNTMFLRNSPIQQILAAFVNGNQIPSSLQYGQAGVFIEQSGRSIGIRQGGTGMFTTNWYPPSLGPSFAFLKGKGNIQVQYMAGYPPTLITNEIDTITANTITLQDGPWSSDQGVLYYPSLTAFVLVPNNPAQGQYAVSNGLYVFNTLDNGQQVAVTYNANKAPADLELVARRTVGTAYKRRQWLDQASKTLSAAQGATGTVAYRAWKLEPIDQVTMSTYRRIAIV